MTALISKHCLQVLDYTDESHTFFTGTHYYENAGLFANINNEMHLPYYKAPCNRLAGASDGKKFGNNIDPKQKLYLFTKIFCRTATIVSNCVFMYLQIGISVM